MKKKIVLSSMLISALFLQENANGLLPGILPSDQIGYHNFRAQASLYIQQISALRGSFPSLNRYNRIGAISFNPQDFIGAWNYIVQLQNERQQANVGGAPVNPGLNQAPLRQPANVGGAPVNPGLNQAPFLRQANHRQGPDNEQLQFLQKFLQRLALGGNVAGQGITQILQNQIQNFNQQQAQEIIRIASNWENDLTDYIRITAGANYVKTSADTSLPTLEDLCNQLTGEKQSFLSNNALRNILDRQLGGQHLGDANFENLWNQLANDQHHVLSKKALKDVVLDIILGENLELDNSDLDDESTLEDLWNQFTAAQLTEDQRYILSLKARNEISLDELRNQLTVAQQRFLSKKALEDILRRDPNLVDPNLFDYDDKAYEYRFFNILCDIDRVKKSQAGRDVGMEGLLQELFEKWISNLKRWSSAHAVSDEDLRKLRRIAGNLDAGFDADNLAILNGRNVPQRRGCGLNNKSILEWIEIRNREHARAIGNARNEYFGSFSSARDKLPEYGKPIFDMLSLKPMLLWELLSREDGRQLSEEQVVRTFMSPLYDSLQNLSKLQRCFILSSFGQMFYPEVFLECARLLLSNEDQMTPTRDAELFIAAALSENGIALRDVRYILEDITNIRDVSGEIILQGVNQLDGTPGDLWVPQLRFPGLKLDSDKYRRLKTSLTNERNRFDQFQIGNHAIIDLVEVIDYFHKQYAQIQASAISDLQKDLQIELCHKCAAAENAGGNYQQLQQYVNSNLVAIAALEEFGGLSGDWRQLKASTAHLDLTQNQVLRQFLRQAANLDMLGDIDTALSVVNAKRSELQRQIALLNFYQQESLNKEERLVHACLHDNEVLFTKLDEAISSYNNFAAAYHDHVRKMMSTNEADIMMNDMVSGCGVEVVRDFAPSAFLTSQPFFDEWKRSFYEPQNHNVLGMLKNAPDDVFFYTDNFIDEGQQKYDPYLRVNSNLLKKLDEINPYWNSDDNTEHRSYLGDAMAQQVYLTSFINMLLKPKLDSAALTFIPLYKIAFKELKLALRAPEYTSRNANAFENIQNYRATSDKVDGMRYDSSQVLDLIPPNLRNTLGNEHDLREMLAYYFFKGLYICMTGDAQLRQMHNGTRFPAQYYQGCTNLIPNLINFLICQIKAGRQDQAQPDFLTVLSANGDTCDSLENNDWEGTMAQFNDNINTQYGGVLHNIMSNAMEADGVFVKPDTTKFLVYYLQHVLTQNPPEVNSTLFGTLSSRYSHCPNGRVEGSMHAFSVAIQRMAELGAIAPTFSQFMAISSYLAAYDILKDVFNFTQTTDWRHTPEEATYFAFVIGRLGENRLFGFPNFYGISFRSKDILKHHCIKEVLRAIQTMSSPQERIAYNRVTNWYDQGVLPDGEKAFKELFRSDLRVGAIPASVQTFINQMVDKKKQERAKRFADIFVILNNAGNSDNDYDRALPAIARRAITPFTLVDWFTAPANISISNALFEAYKRTHNDINPGIRLSDMLPDQKKQAVMDMLIDGGVIQ